MAFLPSATSFSTSDRIAWGSTEEEDEGASASAGLGEEGSDLGILKRGFSLVWRMEEYVLGIGCLHLEWEVVPGK